MDDQCPGAVHKSRDPGAIDEEALAAVAAYRFRPATQNGTPVKVELYIDVNFQIF
jgi:periplasmic protein TonB